MEATTDSPEFHPKFIVRTPVLPFSDSMPNDKSAFFELTKQDIFKEAIYLASATLYNEMIKWHEGLLSDSKSIHKLTISLYKYYTRMQNRCTPYGLFAGLGSGKWAETNEVTFSNNPRNALERKTRLDMNVLCTLAQEIAKLDCVRNALRYYPNNSLYRIGNNYRYIEHFYLQNRRFHNISKVEFSSYLEEVLQACRSGLKHSEITELLIGNDISESEASSFVDELIAIQLLVNHLEPTLTGPDYFEVLHTHLKNIQAEQPSNELNRILDALHTTKILIKKTDVDILNPIEMYWNIFQQLQDILPGLTETNLFQTDLYKKYESATLDHTVHAQLSSTIRFLRKISPKTTIKPLDDFIHRFYERYEDYEVPLLTALDAEAGIGYPNKNNQGVNDLIDDVYPRQHNEVNTLRWDALQTATLKILCDAIRQNKKVINLSEADFEGIDFSDGTQPPSYSVLFKVIDRFSHKLEIQIIGGSSGLNLMGRFAGGHKELENMALEIADFEQRQFPDKILAEVVHLPESRTGNILARPRFRNYEIPYLAKSSVDTAHQIHVEDLTLKIRNNKLILFDKRLNKEIIPRMGNAHMFSVNSLPVYHFLCDLQAQNATTLSLGFNWGILTNQFAFLPRVEYNNTILSTAKWRLKKDDLKKLQDKKTGLKEKHQAFSELKIHSGLPDKFLIVDGDNELLIDTQNDIAIDVFIDTIKNREELTLEEYLFEDESALVKDLSFRSYTNECLAVVLNGHVEKSENITPVSKYNSQALFPAGSEWLYYKIYCGVKTADTILTEKIKALTEGFLGERCIDKWFFIRYADPETHLRFRLHITDFKKYGHIIQSVNEALHPLLEQHLVSNIQLDTYKRELDRYGDNSIHLAEDLFYHDSEFVAGMLNLLDPESGGIIRWKMAIRSVDSLLEDFNLTLEQKHRLIENLSQAFFREHGAQKELKVLLDTKFRTLRPDVEDALNKQLDFGKDYYPAIELLNRRSVLNKPIAGKILDMQHHGTLMLELNQLLASLLHMNLDRLFMGRNRTNEFVVYDLLSRSYKSSLARMKQQEKPIVLCK
ncbi:MAG: lantibiotic dehydratase [Bacteroidetes bacterium]|nr:lantibiotic dehydratase [Bacteroidota bacterium]